MAVSLYIHNVLSHVPASIIGFNLLMDRWSRPVFVFELSKLANCVHLLKQSTGVSCLCSVERVASASGCQLITWLSQ